MMYAKGKKKKGARMGRTAHSAPGDGVFPEREIAAPPTHTDSIRMCDFF